MEKEQWKDQVLNSLEGAKRAEPSASLFGRIAARLDQAAEVKVLPVVRPSYTALAAACLVLLICANIWVWSQNKSANSNPEVSSYEIDNAHYNLY